MSNSIDIYRAYLEARYISEFLLTAHSKENPYSVDFYKDEAAKHLAKLAAEMGFDLVKRVTAAEAAALIKIEEAA